MSPIVTVPLPVVLLSRLGSTAALDGAASARGTIFSEETFAGGLPAVEDPIIFVSSSTFSLSADSVNCTCGAWKFFIAIVPVAFVLPREKLNPLTFTVFSVNFNAAVCTITGFVS